MSIFFHFSRIMHDQMYQYLHRKKQSYIQKRHDEGGNRHGNGIKGVAHHEKPIKEMGIPLRRSIINVIAEHCPSGHTSCHGKVAVTLFDPDAFALIYQRQKAVDRHYAMKDQRLNNTVRKRMHRVPHHSGGIDKINEI